MKKKRKRKSKYVVIVGLAYQLAKRQVKLYTHPNSPKTYTQPQLVACVLLGFYLDLSYRDLEELLLASDKICEQLELDEVPHPSTFCRTCHRLRMPLLRQLNHILLKKAGVEEDAIIVDATGMTSTRASRHYLSRTGRKMTDWIKAFYVVGVQSQYSLGWRLARGPGGLDAQYLNGLRRQGKIYTPLIGRQHEYVLLADKGFDGSQAVADDLIAPRKGKQRVRRADRRARHDFTAQARLDGFMGQRWKVETVISVIKRKTGDTLRSKQELRQQREVGLKALVYNLHRFYTVCLYFILNFATKHLQ
jgi:transposase